MRQRWPAIFLLLCLLFAGVVTFFFGLVLLVAGHDICPDWPTWMPDWMTNYLLVIWPLYVWPVEMIIGSVVPALLASYCEKKVRPVIGSIFAFGTFNLLTFMVYFYLMRKLC